MKLQSNQISTTFACSKVVKSNYIVLIFCSVSVEVEHYIHDKSFRQRMIILSLSNSKLGKRRVESVYSTVLMYFLGLDNIMESS